MPVETPLLDDRPGREEKMRYPEEQPRLEWDRVRDAGSQDPEGEYYLSSPYSTPCPLVLDTSPRPLTRHSLATSKSRAPPKPPSSVTLTQSRAFNFGEFVEGKAQQPVPAALAPHEDEVSRIFEQCRALAVRILYLLGVGLEVRPPQKPQARIADWGVLTQAGGPAGFLLLHPPEREGFVRDHPTLPALSFSGRSAGDG